MATSSLNRFSTALTDVTRSDLGVVLWHSE